MFGVVFGALCISFAPIFVKLCSLSPTLTGFYRTFFAASLLIPLLIFRPIKWQALMDRKVAGLLVLAGFIFAFDLYVWHQSIHMVGAGLSTILGNTQTFYLAFFGVVIARERLKKRFFLAVPLAFSGIVAMAWQVPSWANESNYLAGILLAAATGVLYAAYIITLRKIEKAASHIPPLHRILMIALICSFFLLTVGFFEGPITYPSGQDLYLLIGLALLAQVLGWYAISANVTKVPVATAGLLLLSQPTMAAVWGATFLDEQLSPLQIGGAMLTLVGIYLGSTSKVTNT